MRLRRSLTVGAALVAMIAVAVIVWAGRARPATGAARVLDGDSIVVNGTKIRLYGIDAPELYQTCDTGAGKSWPCGLHARDKLAGLIGDSVVSCQQMDTDRYRRTVAICTSRNVDLGAAMVSLGLAVAYRRYSDRYVGNETAARDEHRGIWQGKFVNPESWRIAHKRTAQ